MNRQITGKSKLRAPLFLTFLVLILVAGAWNPALDRARAAEKITLTCSAQVSEVLKGELLDMFTAKTGLEVEMMIHTSEVAVSRLSLGFSDAAVVAGHLGLKYQALGYLEHPFCKDAMIVICNTEAQVRDLTLGEVRAVFSGAVDNWARLGGPDRMIRVMIPNPDSAAYRNFSRMVMAGLDMAYFAQSFRSTDVGELVRCVPWSVSFINRGATQGRPKGIRSIKIEGLWPDDPNYPFFEPFSIITRGRPAEAVSRLIAFLATEQAARLLKKKGVTPCSACD